MKSSNLKKVTLILLAISTYCFSFGPIVIKYVNANPTDILIEGKKEIPLYVNIDTRILEEFEVKTSGLKKAHFKEYRQSLQTAIDNSFNPYFSKIIFVDSIPVTGYVLHLKLASPKHVKRGAITSVSGFESSIGGTTIYETGIDIQYAAKLSYNNQIVNEVDKKISSEESATMASKTKEVFLNALEIMCLDISKELIGKIF